MKERTLDFKLKRVDDYIIGLWKFKKRGVKPKWCATYCFNGEYFDIEGKDTVEEVLDSLYREIVILENEKQGITFRI